MPPLQDSSIHGIPQIFDSTTSIFRRAVWIFVMILSLAGSSYFIYETVRYYRSNPVYIRSYIGTESDGEIVLPDIVFKFLLSNESAQVLEDFWPTFNKIKLRFDDGARQEKKYLCKILLCFRFFGINFQNSNNRSLQFALCRPKYVDEVYM